MLQEIAPHRFDNAYRPVSPRPHDRLLVYDGGRVLCGGTVEAVTLPTLGALPVRARFAFLLDGAPLFLAMAAPTCLPEGFAWMPTRSLRTAMPQHLAWAIAVGESLWRWYQATGFCGRCGSPMDDSAAERARICPHCGATVYPKICPAVIVAVTDGERLLLTRYCGRPFRAYALVAGFNEIGESIEDTVHREVFEETGLRVKNLRFYRSQPWVFTDSLLFGFFADLDGPDAITLQADELAEAQWFPRSAIPTDHSPISLTGEMIELFRAGKEPRR